MKAILSAVALLAAISPGLAATYEPSQAKLHIGESATIEGPVSGTHVDARSGVGFIDMGGRYPNSSFTGFIPRTAIGKFGDIQRYSGKTIGISGTIKDY